MPSMYVSYEYRNDIGCDPSVWITRSASYTGSLVPSFSCDEVAFVFVQERTVCVRLYTGNIIRLRSEPYATEDEATRRAEYCLESINRYKRHTKPAYWAGAVPEVQSIPTRYGGEVFRSKLEAQWAVFFDFFHWEWEYERDGLALSPKWYLPDFILHGVKLYIAGRKPYKENMDVYVEIKPRDRMNNTAWVKAKSLQGTGHDVLILGDMPKGNTDDEILDNLNRISKGSNVYSYLPALFPCINCQQNCPDYCSPGFPYYFPNGACHRDLSFLCFSGSFLFADSHNRPVIGRWHKNSVYKDTLHPRFDGDPKRTLAAYACARTTDFAYGQPDFSGRAPYMR